MGPKFLRASPVKLTPTDRETASLSLPLPKNTMGRKGGKGRKP
jgi:hypothetical protein